MATRSICYSNNDDQAKDNNRHAMMDSEEQYEYETILAKILNEKKLALANSPEVLKFLCGVSACGNQRRTIM